MLCEIVSYNLWQVGLHLVWSPFCDSILILSFGLFVEIVRILVAEGNYIEDYVCTVMWDYNLVEQRRFIIIIIHNGLFTFLSFIGGTLLTSS